MAITYQGGQERKPVKKNRNLIIILGCAAAFAVILLVAFGIWTYTNSGLKASKYGSPQEVAQSFIEKFYAGDAAGVFAMQPEPMQARSKQDTSMTYSSVEGEVDLETVIEAQRGTMDAYLEGVQWGHGDNWKASFKLGDYVAYGSDETDALSLSFRMMGVGDDFELDEAGYVPVTATISGDSGVEPADVEHFVPVIKYKGDWYIGQEYGDAYVAAAGDMPTMTGDLLDGYHVVGEFDANGDRVYRTEDGLQMFRDEDGDYYYEDSFGNKHYCEYEVLNVYGQVKVTKETKVVGPHGGEELTAETYEDYWNDYYEKQVAEFDETEHAHVHDGSVSGNSAE